MFSVLSAAGVCYPVPGDMVDMIRLLRAVYRLLEEVGEERATGRWGRLMVCA